MRVNEIGDYLCVFTYVFGSDSWAISFELVKEHNDAKVVRCNTLQGRCYLARD